MATARSYESIPSACRFRSLSAFPRANHASAFSGQEAVTRSYDSTAFPDCPPEFRAFPRMNQITASSGRMASALSYDATASMYRPSASSTIPRFFHASASPGLRSRAFSNETSASAYRQIPVKRTPSLKNWSAASRMHYTTQTGYISIAIDQRLQLPTTVHDPVSTVRLRSPPSGMDCGLAPARNRVLPDTGQYHLS